MSNMVEDAIKALIADRDQWKAIALANKDDINPKLRDKIEAQEQELEHMKFRVKQTEYASAEMLNSAIGIADENNQLRAENDKAIEDIKLLICLSENAELINPCNFCVDCENENCSCDFGDKWLWRGKKRTGEKANE